MIQPIALPRGAELLAETAVGARSFSAGFWFPTGSRHEAPHERGFAHFVEHLLFKGTEGRSALDLARAADRVGGYLNAFTERDGLCVHCSMPASEWRLALGLLVDMAFRSTFPQAEVERERGVITSEILAGRDDPEEASHDLLLEGIFPGQPVGRRIAGDPVDIASADRDALRGFWRRHYTPSMLLAATAGPVEPGSVAEELAKLLDTLPATAGGDIVSSNAHQVSGFVPACRFEPAAIEQVYLYEALHIPGPFEDGFFQALSVANSVLGESMSSRLFQGLRERLGICYSVYSNFSIERDEGLWIVQASAAPADFSRLLEELDREVDDLVGGRAPLSDVEVREAVGRLAGSFELALDDTEYRARRMARQLRYSGSVLDAEETKVRMLAVDRPAAVSALERVFAGRERARFAYGHRVRGAADALRAAHGKGDGRG